MAAKPAEPPPSGHRSEREERVGPVTIVRHVKDDGRALIIYTRDTHPPA